MGVGSPVTAMIRFRMEKCGTSAFLDDKSQLKGWSGGGKCT